MRTTWHCSAILRVAILGIALLTAGAVHAGGFNMDASSESGLPGDPVTVTVTMDNPQPARGFSFGLTHDASIVTLTGVSQGSVTQATNGGAGADFFFTDINPIGGPGALVGCVVSLDAPIEDIPIGVTQEIALLDYTISGGAAPGSVSPLDFSNGLGDPPVLVVISVAGTSFFPTTTSGEVQVLTPAVTGLSCNITDVCTCEATLSWSNAATYDSIQVFENGGLVATLPGTATGTTVNLSTSGVQVLLQVVPIASGIGGDPASCMVQCDPPAPPIEPNNIACSVDSSTCTATITWTNQDAYSSIDVLVDGNLDQTVGGAVEMATVSLPGPGTFTVCLVAKELSCGAPAPLVCCDATCLPPFVRGDGNTDGIIDVSDPILALGHVFLAQIIDCELALDANDDELLGVDDAIFLLDLIFQGGPDPAAPFPLCGADPTPGGLGCDLFDACP